eukprot:3181348-Amphidinium_carterae.1
MRAEAVKELMEDQARVKPSEICQARHVSSSCRRKKNAPPVRGDEGHTEETFEEGLSSQNWRRSCLEETCE